MRLGEMEGDLKEKVLAESKKRQALVHPFILPSKECYNENKWHYIVYELATGGTLEDAIKKREQEGRAVSEAELMHLFAMIVLALEETHSNGWLHRNLSSAHIYLDKDEKVAKLGSYANIPWKEFKEKEYENPLVFYLSP